jgi:hypothetical protein
VTRGAATGGRSGPPSRGGGPRDEGLLAAFGPPPGAAWRARTQADAPGPAELDAWASAPGETPRTPSGAAQDGAPGASMGGSGEAMGTHAGSDARSPTASAALPAAVTAPEATPRASPEAAERAAPETAAHRMAGGATPAPEAAADLMPEAASRVAPEASVGLPGVLPRIAPQAAPRDRAGAMPAGPDASAHREPGTGRRRQVASGPASTPTAEPGPDRDAGPRAADEAASDARVRCLLALLEARGWGGAPRDLIRALPHAEARPDLTDIRNALAVLGHPTRPVRLRGGRIDPRRLPALLEPRRGPPSVLYRAEDGAVLRFDGADGRVRRHRDRPVDGRLYAVVAPEAPSRRESWVGAVMRRFTPEIGPLLLCSAVIAMLGLGGPLFVMTAFDLASGARDAAALPALVAGAAAALAAEAWLRGLRRGVLARIGERLDWLVATAVFSQLMALPTALVAGAGRAAQVSRIRDFTGIREFLTGPFAVAALDLPASLTALALLAALGGWIALAPMAAAAGFVLLHLATRARMHRAVSAASAAGQTRDALALEALEAQRTLKLGAAEGRWAARCADAAAEAAVASARATAFAGDVMLGAQALVTLTALATATAGVFGVLAGSMTAGALIAGMMLIWRVLGPLQAGFMLMTRWRQTAASIRQVDAMMTLETERPPEGPPAAPRRATARCSSARSRCASRAGPSRCWPASASTWRRGSWWRSPAPMGPANRRSCVSRPDCSLRRPAPCGSTATTRAPTCRRR